MDIISGLPDEVLLIILCLLPIDHAARSSVLSKRWRNLWRRTSHLDFDVEHMLQPFTRLLNPPNDHSDFIHSLNTIKGQFEYDRLISSILKQHIGDLTSCRFLHLPNVDIGSWVKTLFENNKGIKDLTMACEPVKALSHKSKHLLFPSHDHVWKCFSSLRSLELVYYVLDIAIQFKFCKNLKTLKLGNIFMSEDTVGYILTCCVSLENLTLSKCHGFKRIHIKSPNLKCLEISYLNLKYLEVFAACLQVLVLDSLTSYLVVESVKIKVPDLKEFYCCNNRRLPTMIPPLKTHKLLEGCFGVPGSRSTDNIFQNLSSLSVDLDLNNESENLLLSHILASSVHLQTLEIKLPLIRKIFCCESTCTLNATFWEEREVCYCVGQKLRFVYLEGFYGRKMEVEFIKHLIMRSTNMKVIYIALEESIQDANELLELKNDFPNITLKCKVAPRFTT